MAAEPHFASVDPDQADAFAADAQPLAGRFCIFHPAAGRLRGRVLHVHAFAEEMNKSRRMAALQSRAFAAAGLAVLQVDLLGCGDSAGDFGDATWERWLDDLQWGVGHLYRLSGPADVPLWLWGHRVGALLAVQLADRMARQGAAAPNLLLWQPSSSGKAALQQFLRLRTAAQLIGGGATGSIESLKRELSSGISVEVAGYRLHPKLAAGLEAASLTPPARTAKCVWLEVANSDPPALLPTSQALAARWLAAGWDVSTSVAKGAAFWQTVEIEDAPALIELATAALAA